MLCVFFVNFGCVFSEFLVVIITVSVIVALDIVVFFASHFLLHYPFLNLPIQLPAHGLPKNTSPTHRGCTLRSRAGRSVRVCKWQLQNDGQKSD